MARLIGTIVYGVHELMPLEGFPVGKIKIRLRHNDFAKVFVKTYNGIRAFYVKSDGCRWMPACEIARNIP